GVANRTAQLGQASSRRRLRLGRNRFFIELCAFATSGLLEKACECDFARGSIQRIGGLLEFDPIEQTLNIAGDRVCRHDERGIERMYVVAGHRSFRVAYQRGDRDLRETEIVRDAGEAVAQNVRRHISKRGTPEDFPPVVRETAERVVLTLAG